MAQKLVLLDIDGTLASEDGIVPPSALTACREARRQGNLLYICSGRTRWQISKIIMAIGFDGVASGGGAHVETGNTAGNEPYQGEVIFNTAMPAELVKQLSGYLNSRQCGFSLEKNDRTVANRYYVSHWKSILEWAISERKADDNLVLYLRELSINQLPEDTKEKYDDSIYDGVCKMMYVVSGNTSFADIVKSYGHVCEIFRGSIPYLGNENGEIGPPGIHKGLALKKIAEYHGIPLADTIVFGDSDNDRKMIEAAGIGVAMGNATDALKAIADDVTSSLEDDGIFNGFKKLGLI